MFPESEYLEEKSTIFYEKKMTGVSGDRRGKYMKISNRTSVLPSRDKFPPFYSGSALSQDL